MEIYRIDEMPEDRYATMKLRATRSIVDPRLFDSVRAIGEDVAQRGDAAIIDATRRFDKVELTKDQLRVSEAEFEEAQAQVPSDLVSAIEQFITNHRRYNESIRPPALELHQLAPGIMTGRKASPLRRVALFIPFGKGVYPSSFVTIAVPALVAGVRSIQVLVPPRQDGSVDPVLLTAAHMLGIEEVYRANGVAAVAASAHGTETIPKVDKVVGPGGPAIMAAQRYAILNGVAAEPYFGPSECMIIADDSADPELVAADLINEAEHGMDSAAILITDSETLASRVQAEVETQLPYLPEWRRGFAQSALAGYGGIVVVEDLNQAVELANDWGNEHIQVVTRDAWSVANHITSASELLVGQSTTFSAISYGIGVPTCLPTGQFARVQSGVTVDTYLRYSAVTELHAEGLEQLANTIYSFADYEGFPGHARSLDVRKGKQLADR